jgi:hypothetical protein
MSRALAALTVCVSLLLGCTPEAVRETSGPAAARHEADTWRVIARSPLAKGYGEQGVWTGEEMLVWGGSRLDPQTLLAEPMRDGAAYDPRSDSWRPIPPAPIKAGFGYSVTWTGEEMLVWGDPDDGRTTGGNRGAAYDPEADNWRRIPAGPLSPRGGHLSVWTGDELVVWGGHLTRFERERYDGEGAAYDPETDSWRRLPDGPLPPGYDAMGAWTGEEVIVLVSPMGIQPQDYPKFAHAAAYDPASDTWRKLPRPPFVTNVSPPSPYLDGRLFLLSLNGDVDGGEVNGYGKSYETGGIFDMASEGWLEHSDPPRRPNQTWLQIALADEVVIDGLAYDPEQDSWRKLPKFPLKPREFPVTVWTGRELIVWGGAARPSGNIIVDPPPPLNDGAAYTPR